MTVQWHPDETVSFGLAEEKQFFLVVDKKFKKENINYFFSTNYINKIQGKLIYLELNSIIIYHDYNGRWFAEL